MFGRRLCPDGVVYGGVLSNGVLSEGLLYKGVLSGGVLSSLRFSVIRYRLPVTSCIVDRVYITKSECADFRQSVIDVLGSPNRTQTLCNW